MLFLYPRTLINLFHLHRVMGTPPRSPPQSDGNSEATPKKTRQSTRLRRLTLRTLYQPRPTVSVDPATRRGSSPKKQNFHSYLGVVAQQKIPIVNSNWKDMLKTLKDLVWDDILVSQDNSSMYFFCFVV